MRIYRRKLKIIKDLIDQDDFVSSKALSQKIGVSSRTIRDDIKQLTNELEAEGITIFSIPGKGYCINRQDKENANQYYAEKMKEKKTIPVFPDSRISYILQILLFADKAIPLDEIAEEMYVSRSTIEKDFVAVEEWLVAQKLHLAKKPAVGIQVAGSEIDLRYAMVNCLLDQHHRHGGSLDELLHGMSDDTQIMAVQKIISKIQHAYGFFLSDIDHNHLTIYLCIALFRITQKHGFQLPMKDARRIFTNTEYQIAEQIAAMVEGAFNIIFSDAEKICLAQYLMQMHLFGVEDFPVQRVEEEDLIEFMKRVVALNEKQYQAVFVEDDELVFSLVLYLKSLLNRKKHKIHSKNPSLHEIKEVYPESLEMAVATAKAIEQAYQVQCSEDEVGDIALYYCAATERIKIREAKTQRRVVIICSSGIGGSQLLAVKIRRYFPYLMVDGIYPAYRLEEALKKTPDFIISTIPLPQQKIPVVQVSHLLSDEDFIHMRKFLDDAVQLDGGQDTESFTRLFSQDLFSAGIDIKQRDEVLYFLCGKLVKEGCADEDFVQAVMERELIFSTAIGNMVAIPHALPGHSLGSNIVVGILNKPIAWGDENVQLVFLLNIDTTSENQFKRIFEHLYDVVNSKNKVNRLLKADSFDQFMYEIN